MNRIIGSDITPETLIEYFKENCIDTKYDIDDNGQFCIKADKKHPIANFSLLPFERVIRVTGDGAEKPLKYKFTGIIFDGLNKRKINNFEVMYENLGKKKWLTDEIPFGKFNIKATNGFQYFLEFILRMESKFITTIEFESTGWHKYDGNWIYVHSSSYIHGDKKITTTDQESFIKSDSDLSDKTSFIESLGMLNICDRKVTYGLLGLTLVSVVTTPLMQNGLSPNFSMWIEGKSGLGKTTIAKLFTQLFEVTKIVHVYDYKKDIKNNALNRDCVSIFDDYGTAKSRQKEVQMYEKVEEIIRWAGDREVSANFSVLPEGMALFTGESFLSINDKNASSIARLVRIQMDNILNPKEKNYDPLKEQKLTYFQSNSYLSTSIGYYLQWLKEKLNSNFIEDYRQDFTKLKEEIRVQAHARHIDSIIHLIVAFNFYLSYGREKEFITPGQFTLYSSMAKEVFLDLLHDQNILTIDPNIDLFIEALKSLIARGKIIIIVKGRGYSPDSTPHGMLDIANKTLSMNWQSVYDIVVEEILSTQDPNFEYVSDKMLGKLLNQHRFIIRQADRKNTKPIAGLGGRAIQFRTDKIKDLVDIVIQQNKDSMFNNIMNQLNEIGESNEAYEERLNRQSKKKQRENKKELDRLLGDMF